MIIRLNTDSTITIEPQKVPEDLASVYVSYIFPKGLNFLQPVLTWGGIRYPGNNIYIEKAPTNFRMKVTLYDGVNVYKEYRLKETPRLYIGYNINNIEPDIIKYLRELEEENRELKERGDII